MNDAKARLVGRLAVLGINPVRCRAERGRAQVTAEKNHCSCRVLQQSRDVQPDVLGLITSRDGGPTAASVTQWLRLQRDCDPTSVRTNSRADSHSTHASRSAADRPQLRMLNTSSLALGECRVTDFWTCTQHCALPTTGSHYRRRRMKQFALSHMDVLTTSWRAAFSLGALRTRAVQYDTRNRHHLPARLSDNPSAHRQRKGGASHVGRDPIPSPRNLWSEKVKPSPLKKIPKRWVIRQISGLREIVCVRRYVDRQMERHNTRRDGRNHHNYIHANRHEALYFKITEYTGPEWIFFQQPS